jgi:hypothetical protein
MGPEVILGMYLSYIKTNTRLILAIYQAKVTIEPNSNTKRVSKVFLKSTQYQFFLGMGEKIIIIINSQCILRQDWFGMWK